MNLYLLPNGAIAHHCHSVTIHENYYHSAYQLNPEKTKIVCYLNNCHIEVPYYFIFLREKILHLYGFWLGAEFN